MAAPMIAMRLYALCKLSRCSNRLIFRNASSIIVNPGVTLDPRVKESLSKEQYKHRNHPGIMQVAKVKLPSPLQEAITTLIERYPTADLVGQSQRLAWYLWSRHMPMEDSQLRAKAKQFEQDVLQMRSGDFSTAMDEEQEALDDTVKAKVLKKLRAHVYHWKPIRYDAYKGFLYLIGRVAHDYSVLYRIFSEIKKREQDFKPKTMFDFGSGVGSATWASHKVWEDSLVEHYCVDSSADMNTLARLLLQGGEEEQDMCYGGVHFRQFFPPVNQNTYDLVVSAHSLLDLASSADRLKMILALWRKTKQFLVIIENGTNAGFNVIMEARDFILQLGEESQAGDQEGELIGHVFAPCAHEEPCPRQQNQDGTPCNFEVLFSQLTQYKKPEKSHVARFSFVVMRKGERPTSDTQWSRIVRPVSTPSKRVHCRTCSSSGNLEYNVLTAKKHSRDLFQCARACKWGDLLPVIPAANSGSTDEPDREPLPQQSSDSHSHATTELPWQSTSHSENQEAVAG